MNKNTVREMVLLDPFDVFPRELKRVVTRKISKDKDAIRQAEQDKKMAEAIWAENRRLQKLESMNDHFSDPQYADRHTITIDDSAWRDKYADQYLWLISE